VSSVFGHRWKAFRRSNRAIGRPRRWSALVQGDIWVPSIGPDVPALDTHIPLQRYPFLLLMSQPPAATLTEKITRWQDRIREPSLTVLLFGQVVLLFVVSPLSSIHVFTYAVMSTLQILLLFIASFALPRGSKVRFLIWLCVATMLWVSFAGANQYIGLLLRMVGTFAITVAVGQAVFRAQRITRHQLLGAVVVYLNLALLFMGAFIALNTVLPGAFITAAQAPLKPGELLYFSFTTLTSTGYGDILPVHPLARSLANVEAVVGQLFLAILLARLVSQHNAGPRESQRRLISIAGPGLDQKAFD
jgi:hypothetical protein